MDIRTFKAKSLHEALGRIRAELGPDASVLHTREVSAGWLGWLAGRRQLEVTASAEARLPSRLAHFEETQDEFEAVASHALNCQAYAVSLLGEHCRQESDGDTIDDLMRAQANCDETPASGAYLDLAADLLETGFHEETINNLIDETRRAAAHNNAQDPLLLKETVACQLETHLRDGGPLAAEPGHPLTVAIVGPTGVGKTTTLAKLAAQYRLRKRCRVGVITVDTYRIAAVEQLRTYADLMDLPMEVVGTPREMRAAVARMQGLDLVLIDTAGRSPRDAVQLQELRTMLAEARADETHLVLSSVADLGHLRKSLQTFAAVGATDIVLTKLDEATSPGVLYEFLRKCPLPMRYVTAGQNVPDDIALANPERVARWLVGLETRI